MTRHSWTVVASAPGTVVDVSPDVSTSGARTPFFSLHAGFISTGAVGALCSLVGLPCAGTAPHNVCNIVCKPADEEFLLGNTTFEVQLATLPASDALEPGLAQWHVPSICPHMLINAESSRALGLNRSQDCISEGCNGARCNYTVALPFSGLRYSLSVRPVAAHLFVSRSSPCTLSLHFHVLCCGD